MFQIIVDSQGGGNVRVQYLVVIALAVARWGGGGGAVTVQDLLGRGRDYAMQLMNNNNTFETVRQ